LAQTISIAAYANAILSPTSFASLGVFGVQGVDQYFLDAGVVNGVDRPLIVDVNGKTLYTGVFIGNFAQGTRVAVFDFTSFTLNAGQTLGFKMSATFSSPLALLSMTDMTIAGTLTANGGSGTQGALVNNCTDAA
jgi:hypothetical protein